MTSATITTTKGDIELELFTADAPKAAGNFVKLARQGFYDGVIFHRVVPGFVVQGGDGQYGKAEKLDVGRVGTGGPGYTFEDEPFPGDYQRGTLAMANAGRNTNGSQFFICLVDLAGRLPKDYTIFGQVSRGLDVVDAIAAGKTGQNDRPAEPVTMTSVTIHDEA
ncbi:MAG: peptidylprolyl isomerase [Candidatus Limnocylindrales bacterium]